VKNKLLQEIEAIDKQLQSDPHSTVLWFQLFSRFFEDESLQGHPKRIESILQYIQNNPRGEFCKTPYVQVDPKISRDGYEKIKDTWNKLLKENIGDAEIIRGAANFYCVDNMDQSIKVLKNVLDTDPSQVDIWIDLGRYSLDAKERLGYFEEARKLGSNQPNLPVWILTAAIEVHDYETVKALVEELLAFMKNAREEYGDKLDWKENSDERWEKAFQITDNNKAASALVRAITTHAYYKHYAHTALGHMALRKNDIGSAIKHLLESGEVVEEPRLSSYGPSFSLAKELCNRTEWSAVEKYLELCSRFWDNERLPQWIAMVKSHRVPDFEVEK